MRRVLFLVLVFAAFPLAAQPAEPGRYWIVVSETVDAPPPAARAAARRALRGTAGSGRDRAVAPSARAELARLGVVPAVESRWLGALSADLTAAQLEAVRDLPFVREVRPVGRLVEARMPPSPLEAAPTPSLVRLDYGASAAQLALVRADAAIEAGYTGVGVRVGFLDTLFDFDHPALADVAADGRLVAVTAFSPLTQANYHGLSVSSVTLGHAEGEVIGPAFDAEVLAATTEFAPTETHAEEDALVAGLEWMEANGADVVNISLGYSTFDPGEGDYAPSDMDGETAIVTRAVDRAAARGLVVVVAAGNEGGGPWQIITAPADADSAIAVGAVGQNGLRAGFSSVGPTADGRIKPDVSALGALVRIATPGGGYAFSNGTSFAAPMVTGVVAQILQARPDLDPIEVRDLLRSTASQATAPDNQVGWGVVDALAAVELAVATEPGPAQSDWRLYPSTVRPGGRVLVETATPTALDVFDGLGRRVARWPEGVGRRPVAVPALPAGIYLVRPTDGGHAALRLAVVR
ncbi:S8 family serine peptidase [Rubrivirga marina]|uniref:Peptidase S8/S53 domain-containing protein n=1 Tax=Rubrivirga marina TaxID=1196024 RepID=A0A271IZ79_9BACT|nr:S8 family serine peptidase [Rubrivirga marina]PAP76561.1 hypothetical protein BSZ37_08960 [Rubrivirga marina]